MTRKILLVDDDHYTVNLFRNLFRDRPEIFEVALNISSARHYFRSTDFNLILMDQRLPDGNGLDLVQEFRRERPNQIVIMITGYADVRDAMRAVREGLFDYLTKPFENLDNLETTMEKALELDCAYREIDSLRRTLNGRGENLTLIGQSPAIEQLLQQIHQVAALDSTILLEGESGTGKELVTRIIHTSSPRSEHPFFAVNCGALSDSLLESTLFGYEKGAFTGAAKTTAGYLEQADGGTLFLDEIVDMNPNLQSSLLRVLQEHTFMRLGGTSLCSSDFRLVCACNRSLTDEVREKHFREDLFYRINVIALRIPPLRERRDDILLLAIYFLEMFNEKFAREVGPFTPEATRRMENFAWPGNIRQLRHAIERVVALHPGGPICASHLDHLSAGSDNVSALVGGVSPYEKERALFERSYMERLLVAADGNISEASRISGIARQNLYTRQKRWNMS